MDEPIEANGFICELGILTFYLTSPAALFRWAKLAGALGMELHHLPVEVY